MKAEEGYELALLAFKAVQDASPEPLDILILITGGGDEISSSSQLRHSRPSNEGDQLRQMLRLHCSALAMIVARCTEPEGLLDEITSVIRTESKLQGIPS